jgi:TIR domain
MDMSREIVEHTIEKIAEMLVERRERGKQPVLFLGTRAGGLFSNRVLLYEELKGCGLVDLARLPDSKRFQECYSILTGRFVDESGQRGLLATIAGPLAYREEDRLLSGLVRAGFFKTIITTNIDGLLEDAYGASGLREGEDYRVYSAGESGLEELQSSIPPYGEIIKVLGDLNKLNYSIKASNFDRGAVPGFKAFLQAKLGEEVLVLGYDAVWDRGIEETFPATGGTVWYVSNDENSAEQEPFVGTHGEEKVILREQGNYSDFLRTIYVLLGEDIHRKEIREEPSLAGTPSLTQIDKGVFITCSHQDTVYLERLQVHLKGYLLSESEESIRHIMQVWDDTKIEAQSDWKQEIGDILAQVRVAVLLVSKHLLASKAAQEIKMVTEVADGKKVEVFPVILDASTLDIDRDWSSLYRYQRVTSGLEPLSRKNVYEQEVVWDKLARQVFTQLSSEH